MKRLMFVLLCLGCFSVLFHIQAQAAVSKNPATAISTDGELDPDFGSGGIVTTNFGTDFDFGNAVAIQNDGKIIMAGSLYNGANGDIGLVRYLADGTLDATFGNNGKVITDFNGRHDKANAMALQPDGRIVVAGASYLQASNEQDFAVVRYNSDGTLDLTFSGDGYTFTDMGANFDTAFDVVIQPDGRIVVAGVAEHNGQADMAVARYLADGTLDSSFDEDGKVVTNLGSAFDRALGVALQSDGKIVAAGHYHNGDSLDFALVRYKTDGSLDLDFDGDGVVTTDIDEIDNDGHDVLVQSDGKIVVVGYTFATAQNDGIFTMVRYASDGSLDSAFGDNGIVLTPVGSTDVGNGVAQQVDGKLVLVGDSWNGTDIDVAVVRYLPNGTPDPDFGSGGIVTTDIEGGQNGAMAVAFQADGKIVVAGNKTIGNNSDMGVMRYLVEPIVVENPVYIPLLIR